MYEHLDWPNFTWDSSSLSSKLAEIRYRQGWLLGRMVSLGFDLQQEASLNILTNEIVKSSAIEGAVLNPDVVHSSIAQRLGIGGLMPTSHNVDGIVEMMLDATQNYAVPLTAACLFDWHAALFPTGWSGMHQITGGGWRPESAGTIQIISGPISRETVHFEAPVAARVESEMTMFLSWFDGKQAINPLLKACLAHLWFVTIHAFEDSNGRTVRAIADTALARADNLEEHFYSMSTQIELKRRNITLGLNNAA